MFEGIVCPNDVLFVTPAPGGAPLKVNLNTECAGLLRLVRWGSSFILSSSRYLGLIIHQRPAAHTWVSPLSRAPGTMARVSPTWAQAPDQGNVASCYPHYTPDTERVIIIGDNLGKCGNIGVMASKCGRIVHPEVLMKCSGLALVCSSGLQPRLISHSRVSLFVSGPGPSPWRCWLLRPLGSDIEAGEARAEDQ